MISLTTLNYEQLKDSLNTVFYVRLYDWVHV